MSQKRPSSSVFDHDQSTMLSQQPLSVSGFSLQTQNPSQTLEEAISWLSISTSSFNHPSFHLVAHSPRGIKDTSKILSCNYSGCGVSTSRNSNLSNPTFAANNERFLDSRPLAMQRANPTFNADGAESLNGFLDGNGSNSVGLSVDQRRLRWFNDLRRRVLLLATDQYECRILQETMKTLTTEEFSIIFLQLINYLSYLMVHPSGNYVVQKMVEICSEEQQTLIVLTVTQCNFQLVRISLSSHGARVVEKLLQHVTTQEQRDRLLLALSPGAAILAKDVNGNRVLLHCLKEFSAQDNEHLLNVMAIKCFEISTDQTGCVVMQQCIKDAQRVTKMKLIASIVSYAPLLAEDCFGNYVVQHVLSLKVPGVAVHLLRQLEGRFFYLACNKYGSNVVEKFFQDSDVQLSTSIILELLSNPNVAMLLVDPYGNYVIKSALLASKGHVRNTLERLIKLNSLTMQSNLYGKKLLDWFNKGRI